MNNDQQFRVWTQVIDGTIAVARTLIVAASVVWVFYYLRDAMVAFAGKETDANLAFSLITKLQADRWFAYIFGVGGAAYGQFERRLRQQNIKRLTAHTSQLEKKLDKKRSSSGLTSTGKTRPEDK